MGIGRIEHARGPVQRLPLVACLDLYQPTATSRMDMANVDLKTMAVVRRLDIDQQKAAAFGLSISEVNAMLSVIFFWMLSGSQAIAFLTGSCSVMPAA